MGCYPNGYSNNYAANTAGANTCANDDCGCGIGGKGFSCVINLIIILIVLQFLTTLLCDTGCGIC